MSSKVAQAIVRVLDQLAGAENRIAVSEAAVDMILTKSGTSSWSQNIVSELAELPLIVRDSANEVFQRLRALQEQAQHRPSPASTAPVVDADVWQLIQDIASFPFDSLMDENAPRVAIIGSVTTLRHIQARAQEITAAAAAALQNNC